MVIKVFCNDVSEKPAACISRTVKEIQLTHYQSTYSNVIFTNGVTTLNYTFYDTRNSFYSVSSDVWFLCNGFLHSNHTLHHKIRS